MEKIIKKEKPLVTIVGPTASGKTGLAIKLAKKFRGEIICADSRTVYREMNIGTAKPDLKERDGVVHWGLDLVDPGQRFTAHDFKMYASDKISEIRSRGNIPFLVGGTGLYIDGVLFDFSFGSNGIKNGLDLTNFSDEEIVDYCAKNNIHIENKKYNRRQFVRAIEQQNANARRNISPAENSIIVGITTKKDVLKNRVQSRNEQLLLNNVVNEAISLGKKYGWENEAMTGNVYRLVGQFISGEIDQNKLSEKMTASDLDLAKRQMTWFRKNPYIIWADLESAEQFIENALVG